MSARGLVLLLSSALATVAANLLLRAGVLRAGGFRLEGSGLVRQALALAFQPLFIAGVLFYILAAVVWFAVISMEQLSTAYPMLVSLTFVLVTTGAVLFFQEIVSWQKAVGIAIILIGIVLVARA